MKKNFILLGILLALMVGISMFKIDTSEPVSSIPVRPNYSSGNECEWKWEGGVAIGFWREQCNFSTGLWTVAEIDEDTYGLSITDEQGTEVYDSVIDVFTKKADAPIDAILEDLTLLGIVPENAQCEFELSGSFEDHDQYTLVPFGELKDAYDAQNAIEVPDEVCGAYGLGQADRHFNVYHAHPEKVVFVSNGQDGSFFDEDSIQVY
jgi:hypothetical protein